MDLEDLVGGPGLNGGTNGTKVLQPTSGTGANTGGGGGGAAHPHLILVALAVQES
jgi:hypothetical protein